MKYHYRFYFLVIIIFTTIVIAISEISSAKVNKNINKIDLNNINKLMIVAHPDDETIWGGAHLLRDDYLVVCVTCGDKKNRVREFKKTMKMSNNKYLMLGYPDKKRGIRNDWVQHFKDIEKDLQYIINYKDWELIVTHNPHGEYGHKHHQMISRIVTNNFFKTQRLYYFGNYYKVRDIKKYENDLIKIDDKQILQKKYKMINKYKTQRFIKVRFNHMFDYENWIPSNEWYTYIARVG